MTKQFQVGKAYKLVDASKDLALTSVLATKELQFPENNTFTCSIVDVDGDAWTDTKGVLWEGKHTRDVMCASIESLNAGAFEEVACK